MFLWGLIVGMTTFLSEASDFRLVDKHGMKFKGEGIGLLLYRGGLVCDDGFTDMAAYAICRDMNYVRANRWASRVTDDDIDDAFSRLMLSYRITLDDVDCQTPDWESCSYTLNHNCVQAEGVFLSCVTGTEQFMLINRWGSPFRGEELGLLLYEGGTVCDSYFDDTTAHAICINMNYTKAINWTSSHPDFNTNSIKYRYDVKLAVRCSNRNWERCTTYHNPTCYHSQDILLSCQTRDIDEDCFTAYKGDTGWFPDSVILEKRTFVSRSACVGLCQQFPSCKAAVVSPYTWSYRDCFIVSTSEVTWRAGWSTASRGGSCPDPTLHFKLVDENGAVTTDHGLLLYDNGKVCDSYTFNTNEAIAICSEMGYKNTEKNVSWKIGEEWGMLQSSYDVTIADPVCRSTTWSDCTYSADGRRCYNNEHDIFLTCNHDDLFSIVDEYGEKGASSGLLLYKGGTICPDRFHDNAAIAICSLLGYENEDEVSYWRAMDKHGMYERTLEYLYCSDDKWSSCTVSRTRTCYASDDVYVQCSKQEGNKLAAVYIVLIVVVVLLVITGGVCFVRKRRQQFTSQQTTSQQNQTGQINNTAAGDSNIQPLAVNLDRSTENIYEAGHDEPVPALGTDNLPPPQYEEPAVQFEDDQIPSYEEVMANDHIYQAPNHQITVTKYHSTEKSMSWFDG